MDFFIYGKLDFLKKVHSIPEQSLEFPPLKCTQQYIQLQYNHLNGREIIQKIIV